MKAKIKNIIKESVKAKEGLLENESANIEKAARLIIDSLKGGGKLLAFGNGGSAADSQHMAAELVGRFGKERRALGAIALTTNTSVLTAIANDYGYGVTFSRQIEALAKPGDVALGISTSGNSKNVIDAVKVSKAMGLKTVGLTGNGGGRLKRECDVCIVVGSNQTPRIQESHLTICHILCQLIEEELFK